MQQLLASIGLLIIGVGLLMAVVSVFAHFPTRRDPAPGHKTQDP